MSRLDRITERAARGLADRFSRRSFLARLGALVAGVLIGLVEALGGLLIDPAYKYPIIFSMYLLVVMLRPRGLFGRY